MWFYGAADLPLVEEGKAELRRLRREGMYPELTDDTDCYTTGLLRTEQTFEILFGEHEHKTIRNLREMEFGEYECHSFEELKDDKMFSVWCHDETGEVVLTGGESRNGFSARISEGLKELIGYHRLKELSHRHSGMDCTSVMVCHGGVISAAMTEFFPEVKSNIWDWMVKPGFGYRVDFEKGEAVNFVELTEMKKAAEMFE